MHKHICNTWGLKALDHKSFQLEVAHALISSQLGQKVNSASVSQRESSVSKTKSFHTCPLERASVEGTNVDTKDVIISQESMTALVTGNNDIANVKEGPLTSPLDLDYG